MLPSQFVSYQILLHDVPGNLGWWYVGVEWVFFPFILSCG
jgi:hypothetical protein